jgi:DNA (cytosine-5)-methyltransferase 1
MSYPALLDAAWEQHLQHPKDGPTVVSTFAGCGGSSLGYSMAGFRELLAVEWDKHAAHILRRNFPELPVFEGDIARITSAHLDLDDGELDVLDGSPPCQGFSTMGKRMVDDPRNQLFQQFVRLLRMWQPKMFVMENVAGMVKGNMKPLYREVMEELTAQGYRVQARLLDASYLGVPQARVRLVFIGVRADLNRDPVFPKPMHPRFTVRDAISGIADDELGLLAYPKGKVQDLGSHIQPGDNGSKVLKDAGKKGNWFSISRLNLDTPSPTVRKIFGEGFSGFLHPFKWRYMSSVELCRLQSFPDRFDWADSTYTQIHARLGNSVPPLMMRAVAEQVRDLLAEAVV